MLFKELRIGDKFTLVYSEDKAVLTKVPSSTINARSEDREFDIDDMVTVERINDAAS